MLIQLDRRTLLDNLASVLLTVDELCDGGKILEVDPSAIANRVRCSCCVHVLVYVVLSR